MGQPLYYFCSTVGEDSLIQESKQGGSIQIKNKLFPGRSRLSSRKRWIGYALKAKGEIIVDAGAKQALTKGGRSLLPSGILEISGHFRFGDAVYCVDTAKHRFAQGLVNYSTADLQSIKGQHTSQIIKILGHKEYDEVIHRDNLVLL